MLINNNFKHYTENRQEKKKRDKNQFFLQANAFRLIIHNIFFYLIFISFIYFIVSIFSSSISATFNSIFSKPKSTLVLNFDGALTEDYGVSKETDSSNYFEICEALRLCSNDKNIKEILLNLDNLSHISIVQVQELGQLINNIKEGTKIVAYSSSYGQLSYALASYANRIVMHKNGSVVFNGITAQVLFYKKFFDKLGIDVDVIATGDYKSAGEPFFRSDFSKKAKENLDELIHSLYQNIASIIYSNQPKRNVPTKTAWLSQNSFYNYSTDLPALIEKFQQANNFSKYEEIFSSIAYEQGWVDEVISLSASYKTEDLLKLLEFNSSYIDGHSYLSKKVSRFSPNKIGVLTLEGSIVDESYSKSGVILPSRVCKEASELFKDESVKAVVLRINSGGGSAVASEAIRSHIKDLATTYKKPVVVSMGDTCASGGYWISTLADEIYANQNSLTGSIGVVYAVPNFSNLVTQKLQISTDGVSHGGMGGDSLISAMTPQRKKFIQAEVDAIYSKFINLVSESQNKNVDEVLAHAGGRVYLGSHFRQLGLIDGVATFYDTLSAAARLAGIANYQPYFKMPTKSFSEVMASQIQKEFFKRSSLSVYAKEFDVFNLYQDFMIQTKGAQLLSPVSIYSY